MTGKQEYPGWFLWLWERGFLVAIAVGLALTVAVLVLAYYLDQRLDGIERKLTYEPPGRYEAPDLDAYAAAEIAPQAVAVERAVYVPIYSHVYYQHGRPYSLAATFSIRNKDVQRPICVRSVRYYDTSGKPVKTHVDRLLRLDPLETIEFLVDARDTTGGSGANFIVQWLATEPVDEPVIEAVMVGTVGTQGICFRSSGKALASAPAENR